MNRQRAVGGLRKSPMELELKNECKKIPRVWDISRDVIFRSGIEKFLAARGNGRDPLIFQAKIPPGFVVILGLDFSGENFPPPLVDQQSKRKDRKSTRLNSSHANNSYAVFCLKKR